MYTGWAEVRIMGWLRLEDYGVQGLLLIVDGDSWASKWYRKVQNTALIIFVEFESVNQEHKCCIHEERRAFAAKTGLDQKAQLLVSNWSCTTLQ